MIDFFKNFGSFLLSLVSLLINFIKSLIDFITMLPSIINELYVALTWIPTSVSAFCTATIVIAVLFLFIGRGKSN